MKYYADFGFFYRVPSTLHPASDQSPDWGAFHVTKRHGTLASNVAGLWFATVALIYNRTAKHQAEGHYVIRIFPQIFCMFLGFQVSK